MNIHSTSLMIAAATLTGCTMPHMTATQALPTNPGADTAYLAELKDGFDDLEIITAKEVAVELRGTGFAQVSGQPGKTVNERRLLAIRAARIEALRDLTEQVHGISLSSRTSLAETVVKNDRVEAIVEGEIRGAQTVRITPRDNDSFEVVMALSPDTVRYILRAAQGAQ